MQFIGYCLSILLIRYLLGLGCHYVLTRKFNSDGVEGLFSGLRGCMGRNDQLNVLSKE